MDNISKIKDRLGIVDVVSGYLKLQKAGINFKTPCPFHNEKTPSFFISPDRQIWHCFGCQKGGDIFSFVQEIEGVDFSGALKILAAKAGVELEELKPDARHTSDLKDSLYKICELSAKFFEKQLHHSNCGKSAIEYLKSRGLEDATILKFRLGFAPHSWDGLNKYLKDSGFSEKEIVDAGMAIKRESSSTNQQSGIYDRFRSRIIFPISDITGRVIGFTGRVFEVHPEFIEGQTSPSTSSGRQTESVAKYINTPQTLIYDKSRILYGLDQTRTEIRRSGRCLLVEGNMDAIMSYQAGVKNVVASSGTALTPNHLSILKRYSDNLDFCFDADSAGAFATKRGIGMAIGQGFNVKVVSVEDKECKDPADYVKKYGREWEKAVSGAKPVIDFYFNKAKEGYDPARADSKKKMILAISPFVKRLSSRVEKAHWISQLSNLLRVKEDVVAADIASAEDDLSAYENSRSNVSEESRKPTVVLARQDQSEIMNTELLSVVFKKPILFKDEIPLIKRNILTPLAVEVFDKLGKEDLEQFNFNNFTTQFSQEKMPDLKLIDLRSQIFWGEKTEEELVSEFKNITNNLNERSIKSKLNELDYEMKSAEAAKDKTKINALAAKFTELASELSEIHTLKISK